MISYYELLGMIKEDKAPKKIIVHLTKNPKIYKAVYDFGDFNYYKLYEEEIIDDDYKDYLAECFLESSMFDKNIEILDKKKIKKINKSYNIRILDLKKPHKIKDYDMEQLLEMVQDIYNKQGEIIDKLNEVSK